MCSLFVVPCVVFACCWVYVVSCFFVACSLSFDNVCVCVACISFGVFFFMFLVCVLVRVCRLLFGV